MKINEAKNIWVNTYKLDKDMFDSIFEEMSEITAAKLSKEIESIKNDNISDTSKTRKSYLKEEGISKVHAIRSQNSRIGLV